MSRRLRIALIVAGVIIALAAVVPFLVPVDPFRAIIERKASAALGRDVELGRLSLSLWRGSLVADNLRVADDPRFSRSPFLTASSVRVGVRILPLIVSRTLTITSVVIDNPDVTLIRDASGTWNFASIGGGSASKSAAPNSDASSELASSDTSIGSLQLRSGRVVVGSTASGKRSTYDRVTVTATNVAAGSTWPIATTASLPGGGTFRLDGHVGPLAKGDASVTPLDGTIAIRNLDLAATGFLDPSAGLGGLLDLDATIASQAGRSTVTGTAKVSKAILVAGGVPATEPIELKLGTHYDLRRHSGVLNPSTIAVGHAVATLTGSYAVGPHSTTVDVKIAADRMPATDLDAILPAIAIRLPRGSHFIDGTASANLTSVGPTDRVVTTGTVGLFGAKLAAFDLGSMLKPVAALAGVNTGSDLEIEKMSSGLRIAPNGIRFDNFTAVVTDVGQLTGAGTIDARNELNFAMTATVTSSVATALTGSHQRIPFLVRGTTSAPQIVPDVGGLATQVLDEQLKNLHAPGAVPGQQKNPLDVLGGLFKKKK